MLRTKKSRRLFYRSFIFTFVLTLAFAGGAVAGWRSLVQPPTRPVTATQDPTPAPDIDNEDQPAFDIVDPHPDDALINRDPPIVFTDEDRKDDFYTFLIFGYDDGLNTDTIMVAAYDAAAQRAYIISIPRDTQVDVQRNVRRINSAYPAGRRGGGHAGGVDQLKREVQTITGFRPDFYVSIDEDVFIVLVDAVGGVYIDVPFHMHYRDPYQGLYINIPAGHQRLDGEGALGFVRFRYHYGRRSAITNHQRMEHQHQFVAAMMQELWSPLTIVRIPQLIRAYRDHVNTDLSTRNLLWFGEQFALGDIELITYNYPVTSRRIVRWYDIPNAEEALELINRTINPFTRDITMDMLQLARN
ncbi:MAG: LCP family protein [Defluviitaleaceae bacterium]|nr:LCP family protein [Defluviitaleaceae bacterium]